MSKKDIAIGGLVLLILVIVSYLLLSRGKSPFSQNLPVIQPLTTQNADTLFKQTESNIQAQIDLIDQDMNSIDQINTQAISEEDVSSINSL